MAPPTSERDTWLPPHARARPRANRGRRIPPRPRRVAVVGGGLAGLVVAYRRMLAGDDVSLFESGARLGGQLWTATQDGFVVEHGGEGFPTASEVVRGLAIELGISSQIVEQRSHRSYGFDGHGLRLLGAAEAPACLGLRAPVGQRGHGIASFRGGMGALVAALTAQLGEKVEVHLRDRVCSLSRGGSGWQLVTDSNTHLFVDSVVLATSSRVAGSLLRDITQESTGLEQAPVLSSVTVSLAYPRAAIAHELDATGFVVPEWVSLDGCRACTFSSSKLPDRSPNTHALLRLFFRPPPYGEVEPLTDQAWMERADRVLARVLQLSGAPARGWVDRWPQGLAVVDADQKRRVAELERSLVSCGILLAGGAFHGPGIDGAVRSAEAAVRTMEKLEHPS